MPDRLKSPLNHIHPYPGMIADEMAIEIAKFHVKSGETVLDPFVGTGRTLAAASLLGASGIGIDINPLATIVSKAKFSRPSLKELNRLVRFIASAEIERPLRGKGFQFARRVEWFSAQALRDIKYLVDLLNSRNATRALSYITASVLSATVREVSYCRKDQWKLHRLGEAARAKHSKSVFPIFLKRLRGIVAELSECQELRGTFKIFRGDSCSLGELLPKHVKVDRIITSPPYGDSKTTVQYGAMSELCLEVVSKLKLLGEECSEFRRIDAKCLGGCLCSQGRLTPTKVNKYVWRGEICSNAGRRVEQFLGDLGRACQSACQYLKPDGTAIFVVARRTVDGHKLHLDKWLIQFMRTLGMKCRSQNVRFIKQKLTPKLIVPKARKNLGEGEAFKKVGTMKMEFIMEFVRVDINDSEKD